jgi:hypothetical protein
LLVFLVRLGTFALSKVKYLATELTTYPQETLSSVDLTSFLSITGLSANTGSRTQPSQSATNKPGVNGASWATGTQPAPAGTIMAAAQTIRDQTGANGLLKEQLR